MKKVIRMIKKIGSLWLLLDQKNQAKTLLALVFFIISSIVEISFVASVIPLINLLTGAKSELTGPILHGIFGNAVDKKGALSIFMALLVLSTSVRLLSLKVQAIATTNVMTEISKKAFSGFIRSDLESLSQKSFSSIQNTLTRQLDLLSGGIISPLFNLVNALVLCIFIIVGIIYLQIKGISLISFIVILSFVIPFLLSRRSIKNINENFSRVQVQILNSTTTAYEFIIPLRLQNLISSEEDRFTKNSFRLWSDKSNLLFLAQYPRVTSEMSLLFAIGLLILISDSNFSVIANLSALALAGLKLIPAFQAIYNSFTVISAYKASIDLVVDMTKQKMIKSSHSFVDLSPDFKCLTIHNLVFSFERSTNELKCPCFEVNKSEIIGIQGPSGSGKSTIIKALLSLYKACHADYYINGSKVNNPCKYIWPLISYSSQSSYLNNSTFMSNVMFLNTENECFDESYVRHLSDFLQVSDLYDQQDIGENGSQISGGQKQRVSLIRSLCSKSLLRYSMSRQVH